MRVIFSATLSLHVLEDGLEHPMSAPECAGPEACAHTGYSAADSPGLLHTGPTSHTVWFHQPFRMDEWVLVDQRSPIVHGARAYGGANVYSQGGALVASFAQESLIRVRAGS